MKQIKGMAHDFEGVWAKAGGGTHAWPTAMMALGGRVLRALWEHAGIVSFFVTGRPAAYVEAASQCIGKISAVPDICENGAVFRQGSTGRWVRSPAISTEHLRLYDTAKQNLIQFAFDHGGILEAGKDVAAAINAPIYFDGSRMPTDQFFKILWHYAHSRGYVGVEGRNFLHMIPSLSAVDITPHGIDKFTALLLLSTKMGWDLSHEVAAIGDTKGDLTVLQNVAFPMCPANAIEEVKELVRNRGGYVSDYPTVVGAVDCMIQLIKDRDREVRDNVYVESQFVFGSIHNPMLHVPKQDEIPHLVSEYDNSSGLRSLFPI